MMMQRTLQAVTVVIVGALLGACGGDSVHPSVDVPTGNMRVTLEIYSDAGDTAYASAQLLRESASSGDQYLDLLDGDRLWFTRGENLREASSSLGDDWFSSLADLSQAQELFQAEYRYLPSGLGFFFFWSNLIPDQVHYSGRLDGTPEGARYTVSLLRESGKDALDSNVEMPRSFDLVAPTRQFQMSRSSDLLIVEWLPAEDSLRVEVDVTTKCGQDIEYRYRTTFNSDEGYAELEPGEIDASELSGECSTSLTLAKVRVGQLDSGYAGGSITARQVRSVTFTTTD